MHLTITTSAEVIPAGPITPFDLAMAVAKYAGATLVIDIDPTSTVQDLADKVDVTMGHDPAETQSEVLTNNDVQLDKSQTLEQAGVKDGDTIRYRYIIYTAPSKIFSNPE